MADVENMSPNGRVYSESGVKSRTKQSDALSSDVNSIVARHVAHKVPLPEGQRFTYGDFSDIESYHDCANRVKLAEREFMQLPASLRKHVHNDVGELLELVYDPSRRQELEAMGLVPGHVPAAAEPSEPVVEPVVDGPVDT